jgi:integrase
MVFHDHGCHEDHYAGYTDTPMQALRARMVPAHHPASEEVRRMPITVLEQGQDIEDESKDREEKEQVREARINFDRNQSWQEPEPKLRRRKSKPGVWEAQYRRYIADGTVEKPVEYFGDEIEFPNKASVKASPKYQDFVERINKVRTAVFFKDLCRLHREEYIKVNVRPHTQITDIGNLKYLEDKWGELRLDQLITKGLEIRNWLNGDLRSRARPKQQLAKGTREHIRNVLQKMLNEAVLRHLLPYNPFVNIITVTGGDEPVERDFYITPEQFRWMQLDPETPGHVKMMELIAYSTGMRGDEFLALRWENIEFDGPAPIIKITHSVDGKHVQKTKTKKSKAKYPMCDLLGAALLCYYDEYPPVEGWLFGNLDTGRPFWLGTLQADHLRPALLRMAAKFKLKTVPEGTGWHAFRHSFCALMDEVGSELEVQQRLMRHSDPEMTKHYREHAPAILRRMRDVHTNVTELAMTGGGVN